MVSYVFWHKNGEFMESEHSSIFRVELVTKKIVLGSSGTHFMHMHLILTFNLKATKIIVTPCITENFALSKFKFIILIYFFFLLRYYCLTQVCVGFLGIRFKVRGKGGWNLPLLTTLPRLKLIRVMLEA